ncbi:MAG: 4Fe-4S dicluster domain-containing protein [Candidatus Lokiarchaeota archaeon]
MKESEIKINPINSQFFSKFKTKKCDLCGECLSNCPIMDFDKEKAIEEFKKLINLQESKVLLECQSCFTCNFYCPQDAHPTSLILERWYKEDTKKGLKK